MSKDATCTITGNLARDPEIKFTPSGQAVVKFGVAVNEVKKNRDTGKYEDAGVSFYNVTVWGQMGENVAESLGKGSRVVVSGSMKMDYWDKDGEKRSALEIVADSVGPDLRFATAEVQKVERASTTRSSYDESPFT